MGSGAHDRQRSGAIPAQPSQTDLIVACEIAPFCDRVGRKKKGFKWGGALSRRVSSKLPTWASSMFLTSTLNSPRRGRAVLISDALRTSRPKWFGVRPYPVCERRKKNQNLRRGPVKPKRGRI